MTSGSPDVGGALLTINTGSSSLKLAVYDNTPDLTLRFRASVERIGQPGIQLKAERADEDAIAVDAIGAADHGAALAHALDYAHRSCAFAVEAVGHRVVHGGAAHAKPERLTSALVDDLGRLVAIDPDHMPQALQAIDAARRRYPDVPHVACFDTAFHRTMSTVAQRYPLPRWTADLGVRRYGFHGLSCEFIVGALARIDPRALGGRVLIAHLGSGASITAVERGASVDTTMGFSPAGGLMMGTRAGDLDPTVGIYLARQRGIDAVDRLVNRESGLLGASGISSDVRDLAAKPASSAAADAIELFCYVAAKHCGALAAVLDGVDTIVFTGGIGEHAPTIREQICRRLGHLGVQLDAGRNAASRDVISIANSRVVVRVIATDEELMIARHLRDVLA